MTILERAGDFYAALVAERKPADASVLLFRQYLVQHFQQAGMQVADKVDRARRDGNHIQPSGITEKVKQEGKTSEPSFAEGHTPSTKSLPNKGKGFRNFEHPAEGTGKPKAPLGGRDMLGKIRGRFQDHPAGQQDDQNIADTLDTSQEKKPTKAATTTKGTQKAVDVAVEAKALTPAEQEEIAQMQPSVIIKHYNKETIVLFLESNGVKFSETASHRQLAATLSGHLKRKA